MSYYTGEKTALYSVFEKRFAKFRSTRIYGDEGKGKKEKLGETKPKV